MHKWTKKICQTTGVREMAAERFAVVRKLMRDLDGGAVYVIKAAETKYDIVEQMPMSRLTRAARCVRTTSARWSWLKEVREALIPLSLAKCPESSFGMRIGPPGHTRFDDEA